VRLGGREGRERMSSLGATLAGRRGSGEAAAGRDAGRRPAQRGSESARARVGATPSRSRWGTVGGRVVLRGWLSGFRGRWAGCGCGRPAVVAARNQWANEVTAALQSAGSATAKVTGSGQCAARCAAITLITMLHVGCLTATQLLPHVLDAHVRPADRSAEFSKIVPPHTHHRVSTVHAAGSAGTSKRPHPPGPASQAVPAGCQDSLATSVACNERDRAQTDW